MRGQTAKGVSLERRMASKSAAAHRDRNRKLTFAASTPLRLVHATVGLRAFGSVATGSPTCLYLYLDLGERLGSRTGLDARGAPGVAGVVIAQGPCSWLASVLSGRRSLSDQVRTRARRPR